MADSQTRKNIDIMNGRESLIMDKNVFYNIKEYLLQRKRYSFSGKTYPFKKQYSNIDEGCLFLFGKTESMEK